jgi:hypothetical protein
MYRRRMISAILIVLGLFSFWLLYWDPLYVLIRGHYPTMVWSIIILFPLPLIVVGMLMWNQPYRLGNGRARPYYLYATFCIIISCVQIITLLGFPSPDPGAHAIPVIKAGDWPIISEGLAFLVIGTVIFCVPLWPAFVSLWNAGGQHTPAGKKQ